MLVTQSEPCFFCADNLIKSNMQAVADVDDDGFFLARGEREGRAEREGRVEKGGAVANQF